MRYIIFILLFSIMAHGRSVLETSIQLYKKGEVFHALDVIAKEYRFKEPSQNIKDYVEKLVAVTGTHYFATFRDIELRKLNTPSTQLVMAKRNLYLNKYVYALKRINRIPKSNRFHPEALLVKATIFFRTKQFKKAFSTFTECSDAAYEREKNFGSAVKRYYAVIKETCMINIARIFFNKGEYKTAIKYYEKIPKNSFKWPYTLIQKAWAYYHLKDYNRSLGILMTYDSPLLESYFEPEAETLKALNYFELCQYKDAIDVIDKYYNTYKPRSAQLRRELNKGKRKSLYFYSFMKTPISKFSKKENFLRNLRTQVSKRVKFHLDMATIDKIKEEYYKTSSRDTKRRLRLINTDLLEQINHYVKVSFYRFINNIHRQSENLFAIRLEIFSKVRKQLYRGLINSKTAQRGNKKNLKMDKSKDYWEFKKEFWADELGEYSYALDSRCHLDKVGKR